METNDAARVEGGAGMGVMPTNDELARAERNVSDSAGQQGAAVGTANCPAETAETFVHFNEQDGFCTLVPRDVEVTRPVDGITRLQAPADAGSTDGERPELLIVRQGEAPGLTTAAFAEDFIRRLAEGGVQPEVGVIQIDGHSAVTADGVPGTALARQAYLVRDGVIYVLTLTPVEDTPTLAGVRAEALWSIVTESLRFLD